MSTLILIGVFFILLFFITIYYLYAVFIEEKVRVMQETLYKYQVALRTCYNIKDMTSLRYNFRKEISVPMNNEHLKFFIPASYKKEADILMATMDERIKLLELSSFPSLKLKENE